MAYAHDPAHYKALAEMVKTAHTAHGVHERAQIAAATAQQNADNTDAAAQAAMAGLGVVPPVATPAHARAGAGASANVPVPAQASRAQPGAGVWTLVGAAGLLCLFATLLWLANTKANREEVAEVGKTAQVASMTAVTANTTSEHSRDLSKKGFDLATQSNATAQAAAATANQAMEKAAKCDTCPVATPQKGVANKKSAKVAGKEACAAGKGKCEGKSQIAKTLGTELSPSGICNVTVVDSKDNNKILAIVAIKEFEGKIQVSRLNELTTTAAPSKVQLTPWKSGKCQEAKPIVKAKANWPLVAKKLGLPDDCLAI